MCKASSIEERLGEKAKEAAEELSGIRDPKTDDVFTRRYYIAPGDLLIENYLKSKPLAAFNPGALMIDEKLFVFPRLIFDYYSYVSSIGVFVIDIEKVLDGKIEKPLKTRIILWPEEPWEFGNGCEDPRAWLFKDSIYILYTAASKRGGQAFAELDLSFEIKKRGIFSIVSGGGRFPQSMKDSAFINLKNDQAIMLARLNLQGMELCWRAELDLRALTIDEKTLKPVLAQEKWEYKVGWSTNAVELSADKYLVGWHGVLKEDDSYRDGLAVVDAKGELLALSNYILAPKGLIESYGDRPLVIFGCGLVKYEEFLIWVGGMSDYSIGIFITELDKALEKLKWIR